MSEQTESESRKLLGRLRDTLARNVEGQARLDQITQLTARSMGTEVCSIYLFMDDDVLELCATQGLNPAAVHQTRMRLGEGLVGRVASRGRVINTPDAPSEDGFRYMRETGEEIYSSFLGVPIQRLGKNLGVLVVQSKTQREYSADEVYALEVVAMVLAEMTELGAFLGEGAALSAQHQKPVLFRGSSGQEGAAEGHAWLHEPRVVVTNPIADDPHRELERLIAAIEQLQVGVDKLLEATADGDKEQFKILEVYRMFTNSKSWLRRMQEDISRGLSAEAAVEKEQSQARARMGQVQDAYLRERLSDLDDLSNRLLRILTNQGTQQGLELPKDPILIARNIGPAELLEYGRKLKGVVLEHGSVGSHAAIVARALAIPLVVHARRISTEALNGDHIMVDGDQGFVHLRPDDQVVSAFRDKIAMNAKAQVRYASLKDKPAITRCGKEIILNMNAGLMADLPSLKESGAYGVGLFRTELQFLVRNRMPKRMELAEIYSRVLDAAKGKRVAFRTLDIGSDKVLPYMTPNEEPNPALGWRAIRVGLDRPGVMRMQLQALIRAANGRPLTIMFPFIAQLGEYRLARAEMEKAWRREERLGHQLPEKLEVGAMLETPSLAYAPKQFFEEVNFLSVGGNDLKQFFFAADRENERVRRRYDVLEVSFLSFLENIVQRCFKTSTPLSFCGEDAGRPIEALCLAAIGFRTLSMRPASIGPVKALIRRCNVDELSEIIRQERDKGEQSVRPAVIEWLRKQN
ncbi:MAG: phosphoenolpyruvate--protein phosphotransferase [Aestuariivita sp.]|nr:phosphoenolpyruvate--protein phosphotransferase [Aestuariivita sp.]MCY4202279.1 phosphoenolpyruvate--protein phosphotransferase [Aestuariivita sp.]MCY4289889.1 phosphoenolpyruvate--protein phosphotransferase [Aestuariivita sp.]MCY4346725.1 phosphoenolpyruvate--protein phosphotransferase [Aestuariivita sp.]